MLDHLERLAALAEQFGAADANLGTRLESAAQGHGLAVALFDSALKPPEITLSGVALLDRVQPHVKVDDVKSPDECSRIYFAVDSLNGRFIVDHIGVHDYGR